MEKYINKEELASYVDHTGLKPDLITDDIEKLCNEAVKYSFASVCINPCYVSIAKEFLKDSKVKVCTVIGFPLGTTTTEVKVLEASQAIKNGAAEIDMVLNIGALKEEKFDYVEKDIKAVCESCKGKALVKVIIETCLLNNDQIIKACELAVSASADYVKTSTGFSLSGAKESDVVLMKETVGKSIGVKASGGIKDLNTMIKMIKAGATRIGTSSSVSIMKEKIKNK
ncbi:MAG: deoxyribose-phosphate aldolase [Firmicutes bacterium]|nr:deoxyribose-phosphate aldolase [Bacillota bacterium]